MTVELKNDLAITGVLVSVDQFLNIKLDNIKVVDEGRYPHMVKNNSSDHWDFFLFPFRPQEVFHPTNNANFARKAQRTALEIWLGANFIRQNDPGPFTTTLYLSIQQWIVKENSVGS